MVQERTSSAAPVEATAKLKTRDRILLVSLELLNRLGAPQVRTNLIAEELEISPGNLYYHFRNKDQIVFELYQMCEAQLEANLVVPDQREITIDDLWLFIHLLFESIVRYRFLYRDHLNLFSDDRRLKSRLSKMMNRIINKYATLCRGLVASGYMAADEDEIKALAQNILLIASQWMMFEQITTNKENDEYTPGRAAYQVMQMIQPYLQGGARLYLKQLSQDYLHVD